jgi:hypothetical protein
MQNLAKEIEYSQPCLEYGRILAEGEGCYTVLTSFGEVMSEQAVGCLVRPRMGDKVLLSMDTTDDCFILSVLRRDVGEKVQTELVFDGQVNLHVKGGGLSLTSDKEMSIASHERLAFASQKISIHADEGKATIERLSFIGRVFQSQVKRIKVVANTVENIFCRLTQRLDDSFRFIKEHDEVQSKSARYLVEDTLTMHSKNAVHMAEEIVTINAEQGH